MASKDSYTAFCKELSITDKDGNLLPVSTIQKVLETYVLRFDPEYCLQLGSQSELFKDMIPDISGITFETEIDTIPIETDRIQARMKRLLTRKTAIGLNFVELLLLYPDIRSEVDLYVRDKAAEEKNPEGRYTKTREEWEFNAFRRNADLPEEDQLEKVLESFGMNIRQHTSKKLLKHMKSYEFLKKNGIFGKKGELEYEYYRNYLHFLVKILQTIGHYLCSKSGGKPVITTLYHIIIASLNIEDQKKQSLAYVSEEALASVKELFTTEEGGEDEEEGASGEEGSAMAASGAGEDGTSQEGGSRFTIQNEGIITDQSGKEIKKQCMWISLFQGLKNKLNDQFICGASSGAGESKPPVCESAYDLKEFVSRAVNDTKVTGTAEYVNKDNEYFKVLPSELKKDGDGNIMIEGGKVQYDYSKTNHIKSLEWICNHYKVNIRVYSIRYRIVQGSDLFSHPIETTPLFECGETDKLTISIILSESHYELMKPKFETWFKAQAKYGKKEVLAEEYSANGSFRGYDKNGSLEDPAKVYAESIDKFITQLNKNEKLKEKEELKEKVIQNLLQADESIIRWIAQSDDNLNSYIGNIEQTTEKRQEDDMEGKLKEDDRTRNEYTLDDLNQRYGTKDQKELQYKINQYFYFLQPIDGGKFTIKKVSLEELAKNLESMKIGKGASGSVGAPAAAAGGGGAKGGKRRRSHRSKSKKGGRRRRSRSRSKSRRRRRFRR